MGQSVLGGMNDIYLKDAVRYALCALRATLNHLNDPNDLNHPNEYNEPNKLLPR